MELRELVYWMVASTYASRALRAAIRQQPESIRSLLHGSPEWESLQEHLVREALLLEEFLNQGGRVLTLLDPDYPARLQERISSQTPLVLYTIGDLTILNLAKSVAFAGARKASENAMELTHQVATELAKQGYTLITGAAPGIDLVALESALQVGGRTITLLPQGLLIPATLRLVRRYYPALNDDQLLILSEVHPKAPWNGSYAMMRNRLVAGLADFVVIAETGPKQSVVNGKTRLSGTWNCAETAYRMGVPVYVFDLPIEGNQALVAEGLAQVWSGQSELSQPHSTAQQASLFSE